MADWSAHRVRTKTRAAVRRREDVVEQEEMEGGELNLIPYLDIVTNLMLFLLASVTAGIVFAQIDTTLPDRAPPQVAPTTPQQNPDEQPLKLFVSVKRDEMILWSATGLEGTLSQPKPGYIFKRTGRDGEPCDGPYMCETNYCEARTQTCAPSPAKDDLAPVFEYRKLNDALFEIASRRYGGRPRKRETYAIVLQADGAIPYATIVSIMSAMRCKLPPLGTEVQPCALPTEDEALKKAAEPVAPDGKLYDTARAVYDPKKMALFNDIQFSSGFE
ncbi:MAG TPA: biopolymer transporter ExbD [Kofleriaceae bacterium]|nr:biopolymer transporter ExbD [Kofleriaceae bacterium]